MTVVQNRLVDAAGRPLQRQTVTISAVTFGSPFVGAEQQREIRQVHTTTTDRSGLWSADLPPQTQLGHPDAYYLVDQTDGLRERAQWAIRVPDDGTWWLVQCLVTPPTTVEPLDPGLPSGVALVYIRDEVTGIFHLVPQESAGRWGDDVRFTPVEPPISDAPEGAVWVNYATGMIYTAESG